MKVTKSMIAILIAAMSITGCTYNAAIGKDDRYQVSSIANLAAPSVTCVSEESANYLSCYAGPSILGQTLDAAGTVAGGYLLGQGIGKAGTNVSTTTAQGQYASQTSLNSVKNSTSVTYP